MSNNDVMEKQWDDRAKENAYHWVMSNKSEWNKDEYYKSGMESIERYVLPHLQTNGIAREQFARYHVLDIGCGTGRLCRALASFAKNVTGIDISQEMLTKAKQDNADIENISFVLGSGTDLAPIESGGIDFCFSFIVFQHIPSKKVIRSYFEEIMRVLKPGGTAKIQVRGTPGNPPGKVIWFKGYTERYLAIALWRNALPVPWIKKYTTVYGACYGESDLQRLLKDIGFEDIRLEREDKRYLWAEMRKPSQ